MTGVCVERVATLHRDIVALQLVIKKYITHFTTMDQWVRVAFGLSGLIVFICTVNSYFKYKRETAQYQYELLQCQYNDLLRLYEKQLNKEK